MSDSNDLVESVLSGTPGYESEVFERYSQRLLAYAGSRLPSKIRARVDSDDIVQSVFRSFFRRNESGEFSFSESLDLWRLLVAMTYRKVLKSVEYHGRQRRDVQRENGDLIDGSVRDLQPGPDQVNSLLDDLNGILSQLDADHRPFFERRLEGYSVSEIAATQNVSERTVKRILQRIRSVAELWLETQLAGSR